MLFRRIFSIISSLIAILVCYFCFFFFFFQAEDGIRDHCVTGVQTFALPISFRQAGGGGGAGLALVVLLVVAGLASYVGLLLVRPLRRLSSVAAKVAAGDQDRKSVV